MIVQRGTYRDLNWFTAINDIGGKCAYVAIPEHRYNAVFKTSEEENENLMTNLDIPDGLCQLEGIHGGCTYLQHELPRQQVQLPFKCIVVGWDYCHAEDMQFRADNSNILPFSFTTSDEQVQTDIKLMIDSFIQIEQHAK